MKKIEYLFVLIVVLIFITVAGKYTLGLALDSYASLRESRRLHQINKERQGYVCPLGFITIRVEGGKVCRTDIKESIYRKIFDTYRSGSHGEEQVYSFLSRGNMESANEMLSNRIPIDRFESLSLASGISWTENPYKDRYWRFLFYGFSFMRHLFFAFDETNNQNYLNKAMEVAVSFLDHGTNKKYSWDDFYAVSFRTMFMTKLWWQLRYNNMLTYEFNESLLKSLEEHGRFLADPNHYDKKYNHGLNEAAALYLLSTNFPDLESSPEWLVTSRERLENGLDSLVDKDGVLNENSPYYHFYVLEKYWELYSYFKNQDVVISDEFNEKFQKMISYATYILQPNNEIPLLGASLAREIIYSGIYKDMAKSFPEFQYALSQGKSGKKPGKKNIVYPESGQVIMRSDWGSNEDYEDPVQVVFDAGPYRTPHSDFDALTFSLYANGTNLMPDAGLYTYNLDKYKNYFHGTASHNTVLVDGLDQAEGTAVRGQFIEGKDFVSQSAEHGLYKNVSHKRTIALLKKKYVLIIDKLSSDKEHDYEQLFHLFPGAVIEKRGINIDVYEQTETGNRGRMNIYQLKPSNISIETVINQTSPIDGLCSVEYEKVIPCYAVKYKQHAKDAIFVTLIEIGTHDPRLQYEYDGSNIVIKDSSKDILINITDVEGTTGKVSSSAGGLPVATGVPIIDMDPSRWQINKRYETLGSLENSNQTLHFKTTQSGESFTAYRPVQLDLSDKNLLLNIKVLNRRAMNKIEIALSTNNWEGYVSSDLTNSYRQDYDGEWLKVSLGKGLVRSTGGQWRSYGEGFDWANIDSIRLSIRADYGLTTELFVSHLSAMPGRKEGEVIIIFDDGYESILPAILVMDEYGFKGNIAVIADRVENNDRGYFSLSQLKNIKDQYGWDLINHSQRHMNALDTYVEKKALDDFEEDLLNGARFLINNDLNTTPNWYIYPHGATNRAIKNIVAKYYTFARTTINQSEAYPFGDPLGVKTISADSIESKGIKAFISIKDLTSAISDAKQYRLPLFITFHRIHSLPSDKPGYELKEFKKLISFIDKENIKVKTLREFDNDNDIEQGSLSFIEGQPSQLSVIINIKSISLFSKVKYAIDGMWSSFESVGYRLVRVFKFL